MYEHLQPPGELIHEHPGPFRRFQICKTCPHAREPGSRRVYASQRPAPAVPVMPPRALTANPPTPTRSTPFPSHQGCPVPFMMLYRHCVQSSKSQLQRLYASRSGSHGNASARPLPQRHGKLSALFAYSPDITSSGSKSSAGTALLSFISATL
eukprot:7390294-Prymnesium_polylepis.2